MLSVLAAAALAASASASAAVSPACPKPRTFRQAVAQVMKSGDQELRSDLFDQVVDVPAPVMSWSIDASASPDGLSHFFDVLVYKENGRLEPKGVIVSNMRDEGHRRERWLMLTDLSGTLKKAVAAWDELDDNGELKAGGKGTISQQKGPFDPDALERLRYELQVDCITVRKTHGR